MHCREDAWQEIGAECGCGADAKTSRASRHRVGHIDLSAPERVEDLGGTVDQRAPHGAGSRSVPSPVEKRRTDFAFESGEATAQGWLGDVESLSGGGE